jgi:hypothetical protein
MDLTAREWATLAWIAIFGGWMLTAPSIRPSLMAVLQALATPRLSYTLAGFALYLELLVFVGGKVGIWNVSLAKDTVLWFFVAGLTFYGKFSRVGESRLVRREVLTTLTVPALLTCFFEVTSFPFWVEFVLQPVVIVLSLVALVASWKPETKIAATFARRLLALIGISIIAGDVAQIVGNWHALDGPHLVLALYLPVWLTGGAALFVCGLGMYSRWEERRLRERAGLPTTPSRTL